jgi:hypothetical protein
MPASPISRCRIAAVTESPANFGIHASKGPPGAALFRFTEKPQS